MNTRRIKIGQAPNYHWQKLDYLAAVERITADEFIANMLADDTEGSEVREWHFSVNGVGIQYGAEGKLGWNALNDDGEYVWFDSLNAALNAYA